MLRTRRQEGTEFEEGLKDVWFLSQLNSGCFSKASQRLLYFAMYNDIFGVIESAYNVILL